MAFSRRDFLRAAGTSAVGVTTGGLGLAAAQANRVPAPGPELAGPATAGAGLALRAPMRTETSTFHINGHPHTATYEARTTLWEVVAVKAGLTGTNRSCNRGSCGACSVLVDDIPIYSCHTLATEAVGKQIFTVEGLGTAEHLHPLQQIGYMYMAADCGFCTAGWEVTAKALLDKNRNPTETDVKDALAGHICRCAAYPSIIRTVLATAKVLRGEAEIA
jgi:aerobic-type carbon monoxide dehydrogenase small subunit (CoxS/CutS family)